MAERCQIDAVKGRTHLRVHGEARSSYVVALEASGWQVTATPQPERDLPVDAVAQPAEVDAVAQPAEVDADGW